MTTPERSRAQRIDALAEANRIRTARKHLKEDLAAGRRDWRDVLDHPDAATMKVVDLLIAVPQVGRVAATRVMVYARVSASKTCAGMTDRQRRDLLEGARILSRPLGYTNPKRTTA
jgi:hypothetical protein